ncbi:MAG: pre-peptidase C-terminal domain-containing protein [Caldilineaceae bacterium]
MRLSIYVTKLIILLCLIGVLLLLAGLPVVQGARQRAPILAPTAAPDLVITSITMTPPDAEQLVEIAVVVKNQGDTATSGLFTLYLYINPSQVPPTQGTAFTTSFENGIPLPPGGTFTFTRTDEPFPGANAQLYAYVDPPWENRIAESDETNNLFPSDSVEPTPTPTDTPAAGGDPYEEDDLCTQAKPISTDGAEQQHNLFRDPGADLDWVKFEAVANVTYFIEAIADGADADMTLSLRPSCDLPSFGGGAKIEFLAPTDGAYYVRARHKNDTYGPDNAYRLKVSSNSGCIDNFESNDICTAAGQLSLSSPQTHAFCKPDDADWLHFPVTAGAKYKVNTANQGANVDVKLGIRESCSGPTALGNAIEFVAAKNGIYYVQATNAKGSYGAGTTYTIQVEQVSDGAGDGFEPDNSRETAQRLTIGAPQPHTFYPAGDEDWVRFTATANLTYTIETVNLQASSDPVLCLFDGAGVELACDDDSGAGEGARLRWNAPQTGDYFIQVKNYQSNIAGAETAYALQIQEGSCTADSHEPDDSRTTARPLASDGTVQQHNICPVNDQDWVSFTVNANTPYVLETTNVGAEADTLLELYDATGALLTQNDDHTPGGASQIAYTFAQAGTYYAKVMLYNATAFGAGTEYSLHLQPGTPTPTPTPPPTPTPTPPPTPQASEVRSLILVNRAQIASLSSEADATQLMSKLESLAAHPAVQGTIIDLNQNNVIRDAYSAWQSDLTSVDKANAVASAIRTLILNRRQEQGTLNYLVLVGDDRALPFYRIRDLTDLYPEKTYGETDKTHPTGAALYGNYYLSDDYYADREPTPYQGHELYLPDVAVGRLVEAPADMMRIIDAFLASPVTTLADQDAVFVSGYDFVQDMATNICTAWQSDYGAAGIANCSLIGDNWLGATLRSAQSRTSQPYKIQIIAGHAAHWVEGAPNNDNVQAHEILAINGLDLSGALIYTPGCHAGLNVPPTDGRAVDLVQAFAAKGANYIGHTGYGWGHIYDVGWSEKLLQHYTQRLLKGQQAGMGQALVDAKQDYYRQNGALDAFDEKILQTMIFYGLPMFAVQSGGAGALAGNDEFPGLEVSGAFPPPGAIARHYDLSKTLSNPTVFRKEDTAAGDYYVLGRNHNTAKRVGEPIQPLFFYEESDSLPAAQTGRGIVFKGGKFRVEDNFTPLIAAPYNEYTAQVAAATVQRAWDLQVKEDAWYPPVITDLRADGDTATVVTQIGQYQPATNQLRIYERVAVEVFYSDSPDHTPPTLLMVSGVYDELGQVQVKVGAVDDAGVRQVTVAYTSPSDPDLLLSQELTFNYATQVWSGVFPGGPTTRFFVQVVDNAGNVTTAHNKGRYYAPGAVTGRTLSVPTCSGNCVFLPTVAR